MKNITIYSNNEDWFVPFIASPEEFQVQITSQPSFSGATDCVLISQRYAKSNLKEIIEHLNQFRVPCAVVTFDGTMDNQEYLLECGANDVIVLPEPVVCQIYPPPAISPYFL